MDQSNNLFIQLAIVLALASAFGYLMKLLKLPLLVAYLITGVLLSLIGVTDFSHGGVLSAFPEIGVAFVLFFIGMELDLKEIKALGKPILVASLGQIIITLVSGYTISTLLGFNFTESMFLGMGLAFSSTIVVVKLLLEKKDLNSLYGKLSLGILLLEDLVAIVMLMGLTVGNSLLNVGLQNSLPFLALFLKGGLLLILALFLSKYVLEKVFSGFAKQSELLFLVSLAWCFVFIALSLVMGFSIVIGAFLAGVALANSSFHYEIQGKVKPLRDFFVTLFFVYLGSQVVFQNILEVLPIIVIFTLYALVLKPVIFLLVLGAFGFKKHTIFQVAVNLSQISEFSLIVMVVGLNFNLVSQSALTAMALVGVLSITFSSVMISGSRALYKIFAPFAGFFEQKQFVHALEEKKTHELENHCIIVGGHLMGGEIVKFLRKESIPFLVVDFNPKVVFNLINDKIHAMYGDIGDPEILEFLNLEKAKLVISSAPSVDDNLVLLAEAKRRNTQAVVILRAAEASDAELLYKEGADYVIMPEVVSGAFMAQILKHHWPNLDFFKNRSEVEVRKIFANRFALE